ncbi:hypothetical protein IF128_08695 [Empedobacter stercoris]|uniref:hypothetical protein n=1 Tax=Empedobacter stercoris TaxID=1628248 RepID=UPI0016626734|nr:hypothetical protein [Empedobacter stercoris]MCA4809818.1 hypothetical protein [Empedobacter stercoris]QNT13944.1 hypothetical protein HNV03_04325 [Empedobacter stercoris]
MGWKYQVINRGTKDKLNYGIHEIYFDEDKVRNLSWIENPMDLGNYESLEDLINDLQQMLNDAKKHPALLESELNK